jgi:NADH:ubiquinone oxidoreductase subunit 4 (subunit M)
MKYTGVSKIAVVLVWFRMPRRTRRQTLHGAWMAMLVFGVLVAGLFAIAGLVMLIDWPLHG